jgi:hypothetical protein
MSFLDECGPRPQAQLRRPQAQRAPLDHPIAVLARVSAARADLPLPLQAWLTAYPGRHLERDGCAITLVRCGRGMRQTSQRFRTATAAAYAIAQNEIVWLDDVKPGATPRRWRGPQKRKDRVQRVRP